jgi:hypothetical protein
MKIDYSPRASGKTTRLIEWLRADEQRLLLTVSHDEENRLKRLYPDLSNRIVDWESYLRARNSGGSLTASRIRTIGIDNADLVLGRVFQGFVEKITITDDVDNDVV